MFTIMRNDILESSEIIFKFIEDNRPKSEICRYFKCKPDTLNSYLIKLGINYKGNMGRRGLLHKESQVHVSKYLYNGSTIISHRLKLFLIRDGLKDHKCENCYLAEWLGDPIPIELHHINGNRFDNRLQNLQILCPNCHSKTPNNSGKGQGKFNYQHEDYIYLNNINVSDIIKKTKKVKKEYFCNCGKKLSRKSSSHCVECYSILQRKVERPSYEQLVLDIKELGYTGTGKKYGVSDNAVRKWLKIKK